MSLRKQKTLQPGEIQHRTRGQEIWRQFLKNRGAVISMVFLIVMISVMIFAQFY